MKFTKLEYMIQEVMQSPNRCTNCGKLQEDHYWVYVTTQESWGNGYRLRCPYMMKYYEKNKPV